MGKLKSLIMLVPAEALLVSSSPAFDGLHMFLPKVIKGKATAQ